jgi:hypothetical protein
MPTYEPERPQAATTGFRSVKPRRKQKDTPSRRRREARRRAERLQGVVESLQKDIETASRERHQAWDAAQKPAVVEGLTQELGRLHAQKQALGHDAWLEDRKLEGQPVYRGQPGRAA